MTLQIELVNVTKSFADPTGHEVQAVRNLSLSFPRGGFVSIVGPSGCGKTTLLNVIAGIEVATSGNVLVGGKEELSWSSFGFVFQHPRLLDWRNALGNVVLPLESGALTRADRRARAKHYFELVGLGGYEDYYPYQLSIGMRQRVALARALAVEPDVLLMDEPFASLDAIAAQTLREELLRIWEETGKTIVFVTHDIAEAVYLSELVVLLTGRPARLSESFLVNEPYPRSQDDQHLFEIVRRIRARLFSNEAAADS